MGYSNVFRAMGFAPLFPVGRVHSNTVVRPVPNVRTPNTGGNASTDLAIGDAYALDGNGNVYRAGTGDIVRGIILGFVLQGNPSVMGGNGPILVDYVSGSPASGTWPNVIGVEDNGAEFAVQADTFAANQVGSNINLLDAAPDPNLPSEPAVGRSRKRNSVQGYWSRKLPCHERLRRERSCGGASTSGDAGLITQKGGR